jgi:hypothetical protein
MPSLVDAIFETVQGAPTEVAISALKEVLCSLENPDVTDRQFDCLGDSEAAKPSNENFALQLVLYSVGNPNTEDEQWSIRCVEHIDEFDTYADGYTCLETLAATLPGLRASWGK